MTIKLSLPVPIEMFANNHRWRWTKTDAVNVDFAKLLTAHLNKANSKGNVPDPLVRQTGKSFPVGTICPLNIPQTAVEITGRPIHAVDDNSKFKEALKVVLRHEGSRLVKEDGGKGSSKYGIMESTARQFGYKGPIANITRENAEAIYRKIWEKSGAKSLEGPLSIVHFDTYVNNPSMARKLIRQSGGNINEYLKLRLQRYTRLAELRPERFGKYMKGWSNRIKSLENMVASYTGMDNKRSTKTAKV